MSTALDHDIQVTVQTRYEQAHSDPQVQRFMFSYRITIINRGPSSVQLLRRHWVIRDSLGPVREVEGPGVVGETPVLEPGEEFTYSSGCDLRSAMGRMEGRYLMERRSDGNRFTVNIPSFNLLFPYLSN